MSLSIGLKKTFQQNAKPPAPQNNASILQKMNPKQSFKNDAAVNTANSRQATNNGAASGQSAEQNQGLAKDAQQRLGNTQASIDKNMTAARETAKDAVVEAGAEIGKGGYNTLASFTTSDATMSLAADMALSGVAGAIETAVQAASDRMNLTSKQKSIVAAKAVTKLAERNLNPETKQTNGGPQVENLNADGLIAVMENHIQPEAKQIQDDMHSLQETQAHELTVAEEINDGHTFDNDLNSDGVYSLADLSISGEFQGTNNFPKNTVEPASAMFKRVAEAENALDNNLNHNVNVGMSA